MGQKLGKASSQWPTLSSGPLAPGKSPETGQKLGKASSQWSTPESGPLALGKSLETCQKSGKASSQWSTLESGPLARSKDRAWGRFHDIPSCLSQKPRPRAASSPLTKPHKKGLVVNPSPFALVLGG